MSILYFLFSLFLLGSLHDQIDGSWELTCGPFFSLFFYS
jgi:hypothetical protein